MKEITILSGKGGAGKTVVAAAFTSIADNAVFCDSDVDAPDLHLILTPEIKETHVFEGSYVATINSGTCNSCGICQDNCRFDAIHINKNDAFEINPFQCEGCRLCERICPEGAIHSEKSKKNSWFISETRFGPLVHATMGPGEENSGKLVTEVRKNAKAVAKKINADFIVNDGPPGIGCPVIASISGTDMVVMIIEPTISGLHDAKRVIELIKESNISILAIINKYEINRTVSKMVEEYLHNENIPLLARLPFSESVVLSIIERKSVIEYAPHTEFSKQIVKAWETIKNLN